MEEGASKTADDAGPLAIAFDTGHPGAGGVYSGTLVLDRSADASSELACIQAVPGIMTAADFCMFVQPCADELLHIRMLRPKSERNSYMVVAFFKSPRDAAVFASQYEGKAFLQGLIKETCRVTSVNSGVMDAPGRAENAVAQSFPTSLLFPPASAGTLSPQGNAEAGTPAPVSASDASEASPTCSVCLDPLDAQSSALVTTLCNHTMHLACLAKWDLASCPVCRHTHELVPEASTCMSCGQTRGLWMCVICAYVGCGVYNNKHAHAHFEESQHPFAVNVEDCTFWTGDKIKAGSVWDYVSDRFVNRLLSSEDGKVVEVSRDAAPVSGEQGVSEDGVRSTVPGGSSGSGANGGASGSASGGLTHGDSASIVTRKSGSVSCSRAADSDEEEDDRGFRAAIYASRMDAVVDEYRAEMERMAEEHGTAVSSLTQQNSELAEQVERQEDALKTLSAELGESREEVSKLRKQLSRRSGDAERESRELRERNSFLKSLNESLLRDKRSWNEEIERLSARLAEKEQECVETKDELRDMMLHLEAQAKVMNSQAGCRADAAGSSEVSGGDIVGIGPSPREKLARKARRK